ncbi:GspH/FimT family pseudopilin [Oceanospirillum linum]|uniref:Type II secretion system protein H n=1 Tax=Oceanospirillum linum TaxID=966 RepID=A0A1T1HBG7_OCELI|nr:GspH/FimT family protein [Oceanospirillum linum]OOV87136.1 hypothetical protein BTA35_0209060 [Oceanospirillum linum]SEF75715.1 type IV fimbrial biogenesis protein FimT [Oleiphilus messinensis]SMP17149.1 type IV fimbrial biogenesis protein FimT [Oceanospirillum linum]
MRAKGFTLIELLITLIIISVLTAATGPNISRYIEQERLRGALFNLKQKLVYARSEAIKRNVTIFVSGSAGADWCVGLSLKADCDCSSSDPMQADACSLTVNGTQVLHRLTSEDYSGIRISQLRSFRFDGVRGLPWDSGSFAGTIPLNSASYSGAVVISRIGRVKACGNLSGVEDC